MTKNNRISKVKQVTQPIEVAVEPANIVFTPVGYQFASERIGAVLIGGSIMPDGFVTDTGLIVR